jgi:periplasmic protein TonB
MNMNAPIYADFDQIIFEGRSKDYGAFQMRKSYNRILSRASLIAFLLFLSVTALPKMITWILPDMAAMEEPTVSDELVTITEVDLTKPEDKPEVEALTPTRAPDVRTVAFALPTPTPDDQIHDEQIIAEINDLDSAAIGLVNQDGAPGDYNWNDLPPGECFDCLPAEVNLPKGTDEPPMDGFVLLEKEPVPVNLDELKGLIGYPSLAKEAEIEGKVTLRVLVDSHGNYVKHAVLKDPHPILTKAVTDKINQLKTTPGIQAGKPIKVWVTLPFNFVLQK